MLVLPVDELVVFVAVVPCGVVDVVLVERVDGVNVVDVLTVPDCVVVDLKFVAEFEFVVVSIRVPVSSFTVVVSVARRAVPSNPIAPNASD